MRYHPSPAYRFTPPAETAIVVAMNADTILPRFPRPLLFAHRGCSAAAPENTLAAFREARAQGIPGIELDIHLAENGELLVIHDDDLERTTGFKGSVETTPFETIRQLDAGGWKGEEFRGEGVPTLREVFELLGSSVYYDIELKSRVHGPSGMEAPLLNLIREFQLNDQVLISSFNPLALKAIKAADPAIPTAVIYCSSKELPWYLRRGEGRWLCGCEIIKPEHIKVNAISSWFNRRLTGRPILPWTVDDREEGKRLLDAGCLGLISNDPGIHKEVNRHD